MNNIHDDFRVKRIINNEPNSTIYIGEDKTCIKKASEKCRQRLKNEYDCLTRIRGEKFPPKLIGYDEENNELKMEYIDGLSLGEYIFKYGMIPRDFAKKMVEILLKLLEYKIEYGADLKISEHFIIEENTGELRLIDYGISNILEQERLIEYWEKVYMRNYSFVYKSTKDDKTSEEEFRDRLYREGIRLEIVDDFFENLELIDDINL